MTDIITETERLYLRPLTVDDAPHFYHMNADEEVLKYTGDNAFCSIEAATEFLKNYSDYKTNNMGRWAVCLKDNNTFLGWCGLKFHKEDDYVEVGYRFYKKYWNKGYATESCKAAINYGFETLKLQTIYAHAHRDNTKSQRVLLKCGLTKIDEAIYDNQPAYLYKINNPFVTITTISALETYAVRHPVLRPGRPLEDCAFVGDNDPETFHLGIYFKQNLVGVVSFLKQTHNDFKYPSQYQLRGMAILKSFQGLDFGKLLVQEGEKQVNKRRGTFIWLNAREIAVPFYKKQGYAIYGDVFDIPKIGVHFTMIKSISL